MEQGPSHPDAPHLGIPTADPSILLRILDPLASIGHEHHLPCAPCILVMRQETRPQALTTSGSLHLWSTTVSHVVAVQTLVMAHLALLFLPKMLILKLSLETCDPEHRRICQKVEAIPKIPLYFDPHSWQLGIQHCGVSELERFGHDHGSHTFKPSGSTNQLFASISRLSIVIFHYLPSHHTRFLISLISVLTC